MILSLSFFNSGCDLLNSSNNITVTFIHKIDSTPLTLNTGQYTNEAGNPYRVSLLEYIVSNLTLIDENGKATQVKDYHYVNAADATTTTLTLENVPDAHFSYVQFVLGVPQAQNKNSNLPNTTNFNNMQWTVTADGGGYHYMRVEGKYTDAGNDRSFAVHTGPTGGKDYSVEQKLPVHIHPGESFSITMNLNEWFKTPTLYNFKNFQGNIMGDANAQQILQANGADAFFADAN